MEKAHCHSQEYWFVDRTRCQCGSAFRRKSVALQRLEHRPSGAVDVLCVKCDDCGYNKEFEFDISSFFGKVDASSFETLLADKKRAWEMYIFHQLRMEAVVKYLSELAENRDAFAIEFIADAARHFLEKAQGRPNAGAGMNGADYM